MSPAEEDVRKLIISKYLENSELSGLSISKELKIPKSTVYSVLKRYGDTLSTERKKGSGKNHPVKCVKTDKKVVQCFQSNPNFSVRDIAKKVKMSSSYVQKVKKRSGLHTYKVQKAPNRNDKQNTNAKTRARKLYEQMLTKFDCVVMDDETYVVEDFKQLPGQEYFTSTNKQSVPEKFKKKKISKFPKKYLVWQSICSCGKRSQPFISTGTINQHIYMKECLQKRLLPFLKNHEISCVSTMFWPDLASCHYAKDVMKWYTLNNVHVVPKNMNPPNNPELRPVETYWAVVKKQLKRTRGEAKTLNDFKKKWKRQPIM